MRFTLFAKTRNTPKDSNTHDLVLVMQAFEDLLVYVLTFSHIDTRNSHFHS